jgi:hypothetical protein
VNKMQPIMIIVKKRTDGYATYPSGVGGLIVGNGNAMAGAFSLYHGCYSR